MSTEITDAELAGLRANWRSGFALNADDDLAAALLSRLERADARIATLEAALRPFAKFADAWDAHPINSLSDDLYSIHSGDIGAALRLSDIKCARSALRGLEGK